MFDWDAQTEASDDVRFSGSYDVMRTLPPSMTHPMSLI